MSGGDGRQIKLGLGSNRREKIKMALLKKLGFYGKGRIQNQGIVCLFVCL